MRKKLRVSVIAALLAMSFAAASYTPAWPSRKPADQNEPTSERQLIREVHHVLVMLPYYSVFDNLAYRVEGDKVILEGQVVLPTLKSDAGAAVKSIQGVSAVVNNIEVLPLSPMDNQLRFAVFRAIYRDPVLSRYGYQAVPPIHIIVKNGNVTLAGVVDTQSDKDLAYLRASQVPNVFSVKNDLVVAGRGQ